jgi:hypothetical protein
MRFCLPLPVAVDSVAPAAGDGGVGVIVYPNPAVSLVTVKLADPSSAGGLLEVYDQLGRQVAAVRITSLVLQLDVSGWASGVYFIRVGGGGNGETAKLVKL